MKTSFLHLLAIVLILSSCQSLPKTSLIHEQTRIPTRIVLLTTPSSTPQPVIFGFEVANKYPHDPSAFTEGLVYENGYLYESTGLNGYSSLRKTDLNTGVIEAQVHLSDDYFGEGLALVDSMLYQLSWQTNIGWVYDKDTFQQINTFSYSTEGWGLTYDGQFLIMSDGSSNLYFINPEDFQTVKTIHVQDTTTPINKLNELEYINGLIYANIWQSNNIAQIDPLTGNVVAWINLQGLLPDTERTSQTDVLNGIAYDPTRNRLFVTGKNWPWVYEITLRPH